MYDWPGGGLAAEAVLCLLVKWPFVKVKLVFLWDNSFSMYSQPQKKQILLQLGPVCIQEAKNYPVLLLLRYSGLVSPQADEAAESSSLPFSRTSSYEKVQFHHSALKKNQPNKTPCNCKLFPPKSVDWAIFMCLLITLVLILFRTACSD